MMRDPASPISFLHGQKEVSFVSFIIFTLHPDTSSLNGSVVIINQSINQSINASEFRRHGGEDDWM